MTKHLSGGYSEGAPPVPIPNTAVKPFCADDTAGATRGKVSRRRKTSLEKGTGTEPVLSLWSHPMKSKRLFSCVMLLLPARPLVRAKIVFTGKIPETGQKLDIHVMND